MVRLEWREHGAGPVLLPATAEHRLSLHTSAPLRARCRETNFRYTRQPDDIDITPAGVAGGYDAERASSSLSLSLSHAYLTRIAEEHALHVKLETRHLVRDAQLAHLAWAFAAEARSGFPSGKLFQESLAVALAARLLAAPSSDAPMRLQRLLDYIEAHLDRELSLTRLAAVAGVGRTQLQQRFRAQLGVPLHRFVVQRRLERARSLLLSGVPVAQVAMDTGFAHASHMARWMRRLLGVSPRALRQRSA